MSHRFVARCLNDSLASHLSSLSPPTERLFIASLCRSLCGAYVARPAHFRSRVLRFLAICVSRYRTLSRCAWKAVPKLATTYCLVFLSPQSHHAGCPGHGGTQRQLPQSDASTHLFASQKTTRCSVNIIVLFFPHIRQSCFLAQTSEPPHCTVF